MLGSHSPTITEQEIDPQTSEEEVISDEIKERCGSIPVEDMQSTRLF